MHMHDKRTCNAPKNFHMASSWGTINGHHTAQAQVNLIDKKS